MKASKPNPAPGLPGEVVTRLPWSSGPRIVYLASRAAPLTPADLAEILGKLGTDSPVTRALLQLLNQRVAIAMADVAGSRMADTERAHAAGRLEELLGLCHELNQLTNPAKEGAR